MSHDERKGADFGFSNGKYKTPRGAAFASYYNNRLTKLNIL